MMGYSQAVRQRTLTPSCAGSNPASPAINKHKTSKQVLLAQLVEHLTFNQRVRGSNPLQDTIFYFRNNDRCAWVAELVDAQDLKSCGW